MNEGEIRVSVEDCRLLKRALWSVVGEVGEEEEHRVRGLLCRVERAKWMIEEGER